MEGASADDGVIAPWPTEIRLRRGSNVIEIAFDDGASFTLAARLLRAMTPSAADRGHGGPNFAPLATVPPGVRLTDVQSVGRYAVRLVFDDGHDTGLFTWDRLRRIGEETDALDAELAALQRP